MRTRSLRTSAVVVVLAFGAACGGGDDTAGTGAQPTGPTVSPSDGSGEDGGGEQSGVPEAVTVVAQNAAFDTATLTLDAGEPYTLTLDNRDNFEHNLHVIAGAIDVSTPVAVGPIVQELEVTITEPGSYTFQCDVHPGDMRGTLQVS